MTAKDLEKKFKGLTWSDLEGWFGSRTIKKGEDYFNKGRVTNLRCTPGGILACVAGKEKYITLVDVDGRGKQKEIISDCTCPVGVDCKHAVAAILAFSHAVKEKLEIPMAQSTDPDIKKLDGVTRDEDEYYGDSEDVLSQVKKKSEKSTPYKDIAEFLEQLSKESLKELIVSLANSYPEVRNGLLDKARLSGGNIERLVSGVLSEIDDITSEPSWHNHWSGEGNLADFSRVKSAMDNLFEQGYYDAVIEITKELLDKSNSYVATCDDEGDSALQISECIEIGFKAVGRCEWSNDKKILFAVEAELGDEYDVCSGTHELLESIHNKSAWSMVADDLFSRLDNLKSSRDSTDDFGYSYRRNRISNFLISALEKSGRGEEILSLCKKEAEITGSWERYVKRLIEVKKYDEARKAAEEGIRRVGEKYPGIANQLKEHIATLAEKSGDFNSILLLRQEEFLDYPSLENYEKLIRASKNTKNEADMRMWALNYLKTGSHNVQEGQKVVERSKRNRFPNFPIYNVLIDIAEKEKDADSALYWHKEVCKRGIGVFARNAQVARVIADKYPDEALKIWRGLAESHIALTKPAAYETAIGYLKQVRDVYIKTNRKHEWESYLTILREANKKKTRFIQSLRALTGEKVI